MQHSVERTFGDGLWYVGVVVQKRAAGLSMLPEKKAQATRAMLITSAVDRRTCGSSWWSMAFKNSSHR